MSDHGLDLRKHDFPDEFAEANPLALAHDLIAREQAQSAIELLTRHQGDFGDHPQYLILCARAWTACRDFARAQQALLEAVRRAPADPGPLLLLGELLLERGELERAHRVLSKARELAPRDRAAARLQRELREQRVSSEPRDEESGPEAQRVSSLLDAGSEDLIAAAEQQERARQEAPRASLTRPRRAIAGVLLLVLLGVMAIGLWFRSASVSESTRPATASEPSTEGISRAELASLALLVVPSSLERPPSPLLSSFPEARPQPIEPAADSVEVSSIPADQLRTTSWKRLSRDPVALVARADQLYEAGHRGRAASLYRRALRLRPDYPPALIGVSRSLMHAKNSRAAMNLATRVIESDAPKTAATEAMAIYLVGRIHYERGERVAARRLLREATTLPDAPAQAWFYLGETLSRDNSPAARQAYEQYLRAVPVGPLAVRARKAIR